LSWTKCNKLAILSRNRNTKVQGSLKYQELTKSFLDTPIEYLKGVGPARAKLLFDELHVRTFNDLLHHFPFRYVDRSKFHKINEAIPDQAHMQFKGKLRGIRKSGPPRRPVLQAYIEDDSGELGLVWFKGIKWLEKSLKEGQEYIVFGKPTKYKNTLNIAHPELDLMESHQKIQEKPIQPVYSTTEKLTSKGLNSRGLERLIRNLFETNEIKMIENLPASVISSYQLAERSEAYKSIHFPYDQITLEKARFRLKFEELFFVQLMILQAKGKRQRLAGQIFGHVGSLFHQFYDEILPFELTEAQKKVIREMRRDMKSGHQMNRLLQGDVGSGKTIVALLCGLIAMDNGYQVALMAPTEILAQQHHEELERLTSNMDVRVELLTGSTPASKRKELLPDLASGKVNLIIGTHALIENKVKLKQLGLVIIDEQHRFGVVQRSKLWRKSKVPPHILVMSATPIPRTLAMTLYGDLDVSVIDELPPGRKPVKTIHRYDNTRLKIFGFVKQQIQEGKQVFFVFPLIEESSKLDYKDLMDGYESISRAFPLPEYKVAIVHGRMKSENKESEMKRFASGQAQILVATTVIEVGVNIPNASVMVIESAERFGLSQLHQLRGRVGRGNKQAYCILMTSVKLSAEARTRMEAMVRTNSGFELSEVDLNLRGPGNLMGTQQSGVLNFTIADLVKDAKIMNLAREEAWKILQIDPELNQKAHLYTFAYLNSYKKQHPDWSSIS
jgi:ATP-dependent DNA helicase RecG